MTGYPYVVEIWEDLYSLAPQLKGGRMLSAWDATWEFTLPTNLVVGIACLLVSSFTWWCYFRLWKKGFRPWWLQYLGWLSLGWAGMFIVGAFTIG